MSEERGGDTLLRTAGLTRYFGGVAAVKNLDWSVTVGRIQGLIGPNGAGKSTVFNLVSGLIAASSGSIFLDGENVTGRGPHEIALAGVGRTYQTTRLFRSQSVLQNVLTASQAHSRIGLWSDVVMSRAARRDRANRTDASHDLLRLVGLDDKAGMRAGVLVLREQKMLSVAMALGLQPKVLLLDEPTAGLDPHETEQIGDFVRDLWQRTGMAIVIIEHKMRFVMRMCDNMTVLSGGRKLAEGSPSDVCGNEEVIGAYLGQSSLAGDLLP